MCEYCEGGKFLGKSNNISEGVDAVIYGASLRVSGWFDGFAGIEPIRIPIDYCPKCGRDLRGDAE